MADQLCTLAQVTARLQTSAGGVTFTAADNTLINELIDQASDWIEDYTHRKLISVGSATYTFDTIAGYVLHVPFGIQSVSNFAVATSNQPETGGTYTTVPAADYLLRPRTQEGPIGWPYQEIRIRRGATGTITRFATAENGAQITMVAGFATTPPAIAAVAIDVVVAAYQNRKAGASGVIGADGSPVIPWANFFMRGGPQRATLDRYRWFPV